jgi:hypothetical protein
VQDSTFVHKGIVHKGTVCCTDRVVLAGEVERRVAPERPLRRWGRGGVGEGRGGLIEGRGGVRVVMGE